MNVTSEHRRADLDFAIRVLVEARRLTLAHEPARVFEQTKRAGGGPGVCGDAAAIGDDHSSAALLEVE